MIDWGVLTDAQDKGTYQPTPRHRIKDTRLAAWLIEGVTSFVDRGRGLELGTWRAETRYVPFEEPRWPVPDARDDCMSLPHASKLVENIEAA